MTTSMFRRGKKSYFSDFKKTVGSQTVLVPFDFSCMEKSLDIFFYVPQKKVRCGTAWESK